MLWKAQGSVSGNNNVVNTIANNGETSEDIEKRDYVVGKATFVELLQIARAKNMQSLSMALSEVKNIYIQNKRLTLVVNRPQYETINIKQNKQVIVDFLFSRGTGLTLIKEENKDTTRSDIERLNKLAGDALIIKK